MSATIKDIAKVVGVSIATVSRVLNNQGGYSSEVEQKVLDTAKSLNYRRNSAATMLVKKESKIIGIIMPSATTTYYSNIVTGIEDYAASFGYTVILSHSGVEGEKFEQCFEAMSDRRVDGVISFSIDLTLNQINQIKASKIPFLLIASQSDDSVIPYVKVDDYQAVYEATQYLIENGHQQIVFVGANKDDRIAGKTRIQGFLDCMQSHRLEIQPNSVLNGKFDFESGQEAMKKLIAQTLPTAILCASDDVALGVLSICQQKMIRVPDQVSIMGYDNTELSWMVYPKITTVSQPFYLMGQKGCQKMINCLETKEMIKSEKVSFEIVERDSVKKIS